MVTVVLLNRLIPGLFQAYSWLHGFMGFNLVEFMAVSPLNCVWLWGVALIKKLAAYNMQIWFNKSSVWGPQCGLILLCQHDGSLSFHILSDDTLAMGIACVY
ncbi:hypothetical protein Ancab_039552 [Ancistrocladus abbreviatus]